MRILFILLFFIGFINSTSFFSQSSLSIEKYDFGKIDQNSERFVDVTITNSTNKTIYILKVKNSLNVTKRMPSDIIPANGSLILRFQVNPQQKGKFNEKVEIFTSDRENPLIVSLIGEMMTAPESSSYLTDCPEFGVNPLKIENKHITIRTIDKVTGKELAQSKVVVIHNGQLAGAWETGRKGAFDVMIPSGYFYFLATHDGYLKKEDGIYVPKGITEITIPLVKDPILLETIAFIPTIDTVIKEEATLITIEETAEVISKPIPVVSDSLPTVTNEVIIPFSNLPLNDFNSKSFNSLNIIFVLDISSSMKLNDRMNLMKFSLNELVKNLRPQDFMGVVTYADKASVFQVPLSGDKKTELTDAVAKIEPNGLTAGGRGIKLGYKQVLKNYDSNKTNMVVIITDGAFNKDSDDYQKLVKKYAKKGIKFSVVGIKAKEKDAIKMTEAADFGKGKYVGINELSDAQNNLFQAVRSLSFKHY